MKKSIKRCSWVPEGDELYQKYHDEEWGVPVYDDQKIFEFLVLESFQAGLSWRTILHKRENFRKAFANFDFRKVAKFRQREIKKLLNNKGIIRNKLKIKAAINNAQRFLEVKREFGTFSKYMWGWKTSLLARQKAEDWSKDLKKRGFKFLGSTILYAYMQATGMIKGHEKNCFRN